MSRVLGDREVVDSVFAFVDRDLHEMHRGWTYRDDRVAIVVVSELKKLI